MSREKKKGTLSTTISWMSMDEATKMPRGLRTLPVLPSVTCNVGAYCHISGNLILVPLCPHAGQWWGLWLECPLPGFLG